MIKGPGVGRLAEHAHDVSSLVGIDHVWVDVLLVSRCGAGTEDLAENQLGCTVRPMI